MRKGHEREQRKSSRGERERARDHIPDEIRCCCAALLALAEKAEKEAQTARAPEGDAQASPVSMKRDSGLHLARA
nr:MAG TPA: hypothetical protein [Caudoviricetes sp.]